MSNVLWKSLLLCPAILGATLLSVASVNAAPTLKTAKIPQPQSEAIASNSTQVSEATGFSMAATKSEQPTVTSTDTPTFQIAETPATELEQQAIEQLQIPEQASVTPSEQQTSKSTATPAVSSPAAMSENNLDQINRYSSEGKANTSIAQVTSVSQLSDVQPTDWAFQALQSLVERYGCIVGYPDGTYRGNRALTRYEFAAGLNACLDRVNELIATATSDLVTREDLATLQRLQEEFATELAVLRGRVDALEAKTAELEANQFSTTTKLVGEVIIAVTDAFGDDVEENNNTVLHDRIRLDLQTSFTGDDILHTRLATGNGRPFNLAPSATFEGTQVSNFTPDGSFSNDVFIDWVAYDFPLFGNSRGYIAGFGGIHSDYTPTLNPYFEDYDGGNGALSAFAQESPIYRIGGGAGAAINIGFGEGGGILGASKLTLGYLADQASDPGSDTGLLNGDYAALAQLTLTLGDRFSIAGTYVHGYHNVSAGIFDLGATGDSQVSGPVTGTALANNPSSLLAGGSVPLVTNSYGVEAAFRLSDRISISGFGAYTDVTLLGRGSGEIWTYGGGVAFPDLGKEGNLLGIFAGVQPTLRDLDAPGVNLDRDSDRDYGYHIEGFYRYRLTDNISLTPGVIWLTAPGQSDDNSDVIIGTLRTTFNF